MALYETTSELNIQSRFRFRHANEIKSIQRQYPLSPTQFDALFLIYFKLWEQHQNPSNYILRSQFSDVLYKCFNMPDDFLADQIQMALDKGASTNVTLKTWMKAMYIFLKGTLDEKMEYCFAVYDAVDDDDGDESLNEFADVIIKKMDNDLDGAISFADYRESVRREPLLLEFLGQCIPERESIAAFLATFSRP
ncbi:hypothetical protein HA402_009799 [Bradysia odoriphaga]|nr:hypothetical protein HA402_009799 [Bradysia odoriphaga]